MLYMVQIMIPKNHAIQYYRYLRPCRNVIETIIQGRRGVCSGQNTSLQWTKQAHLEYEHYTKHKYAYFSFKEIAFY